MSAPLSDQEKAAYRGFVKRARERGISPPIIAAFEHTLDTLDTYEADANALRSLAAQYEAQWPEPGKSAAEIVRAALASHETLMRLSAALAEFKKWDLLDKHRNKPKWVELRDRTYAILAEVEELAARVPGERGPR